MPGLLKIGKTTRDPFQRAKELQTTGVLEPFRVEFYIFIEENLNDTEQYIHEYLCHNRHSEKREFFKVGIVNAMKAITSVCLCCNLIEDHLGFDAPDIYHFSNMAEIPMEDVSLALYQVKKEEWLDFAQRRTTRQLKNEIKRLKEKLKTYEP